MADAEPLAAARRAPDRAEARAAIARLHLLRALRWDLVRREALALTAAAVPALLCIGGFAFVLALGGPRGLSNSPLVVSLVVLAMMGAIAVVVAGLPLGMTALFAGALQVVLAPYHLYRVVRAARRVRWQREAEGVLVRDGVVPIAWTRGETGRGEALAALLRAGVGLTYEGAELRAEPWPAGPCCAHCGAAARAVGEGVWRCAHCGREAFAALPEAVAVATARAAIAAAAADDTPALSRRALWRAFREAHGGDYLACRRRTLLVAAGYLGCAVVSELGWRLHARVVWAPPLAGIVLLALPLCVLLCMTAHAWARLRFVEFGPGVAAYDRALLGEALTVIAQQGRISRPRLAAHLGIAPAHLDTVLARYHRLGGAPLLVDRERGDLISLIAADIGERACPACGGTLRPGPRATLACDHCGAATP